MRIILFLMLCCSGVLHAGYQKESDLADSVRILLRQSVSQNLFEQPPFRSTLEQQKFHYWHRDMQSRLSRYVANPVLRNMILNVVDYEAHRAGLEPALVLGVIMIESRFQSAARSSVGALGLMQVMPFWAEAIGDGDVSRLLSVHVNVRFGCVILRHYLVKEKGNLVRALARYNGSLGRTDYAYKVLRSADQWR